MRTRVGLLFGGRSAEHDVSRMSAANPIGIGRDGRWRLCCSGNGAGVGAPIAEDRGPVKRDALTIHAIIAAIHGEGPSVATHERIEINPDVMGGKPVIRGTRVPVEVVLRKLGAGLTVEEVIADHPRLTSEDIRAAQAFAADYLADEELVFG